MRGSHRLLGWDPLARRYVLLWQGREEYADVMFNKPYFRRYTRKLVKVTVETLRTAKKVKK